MAGFCLPQYAVDKFIQGLPEDPSRLIEMTSEERRAFFKDLVGAENAKQVNALFESKLLLKNQQQGLINWVKQLTGMKPEIQRDMLAKVNKLEQALTPQEAERFLEDLVEQKMGTHVSVEEAGKITHLAQLANEAKATMLKDINNVENRIAYGRALLDLNDYVESLKPAQTGWKYKLDNLANLPKSALTSILHFSAPFVQGWGMMTTKPFWSGFGEMFKYFADEEHYKDLNAYIVSHPNYELAKAGGLGLTKLGDKLNLREEAIQSSLLEKIPGLGKLVRASSRGFTGFLNYVRFTRFNDLVEAARLNGENVSKNSKVIKDLAEVVNNFTGRAHLPAGLDNITPTLNALFFSPRKIAATIEMFNPVKYLDPRISPTARQAALRQLTGSLLATGAVLTFAQAMGAKVNPDPRSADFGKIRIGNSTLDMTGGNAIYVRLLARIATGVSISKTGKVTELGKGYKATTRADLLTQYFRDKLAPVASMIADYLYGKDPTGAPFSITDEAYNKLTPIVMQDYINLATKDADNTAVYLPSLAAIFGVSMESSKK